MKEVFTKELWLLYLILFLQAVFLYVSFEKQLLMSIESILTIVLTIGGWFAVYYFGFRQEKNKIGLDKKLVIYDELTRLKLDLDEALVFDLLAYVEYFNVHDSVHSSSTEMFDFSKNILDKSFMAHKAFQKFDAYARAWIFAMPDLEKIEVLLSNEFYNFLPKIDALQKATSDYAMSYTASNKVQARKVVVEKIDDIGNSSADMVNFIDDFIELLSDELTFPIFRYKARRGIENLKDGQKYRKLTKDGIKVVEYKLKDFQK